MAINSINLTDALSTSILFIMIFVAVFFGVYVKEYYSLMKTRKKIKIGRIFMATLTVSFLILGMAGWILQRVSVGILFTLSFLLGVSSNTVIALVLDGTILRIITKIFFKSIAEVIETETVNKAKERPEKTGKKVMVEDSATDEV